MKKFTLPFLIPILFLISSSAFCQPNSGLDRIEPPFWWVGMKNPRVQLLAYGEGIAYAHPIASYEGVSIERVIKVKSPNYLFIDIRIDANAAPGTFDIKFMQGPQLVQTYNYEIKERRSGSAERAGFSPADVIYLITPDRFINGDPSNDNIEGMADKINRQDPFGRHGGDVQGILDKVDYLAGMGFTGIWLNPILENNQPDASYHGYATTDFYKVDPRFGTNEQYRNLALLAREKGVKMIMDMIVNHCGSEHWWMKDPPTDDWINFGNKFVQTTHKKPVIQDPYKSDYDHKLFVDGWFVETMPDMNQRNALFANYLIQNSIWWIEYAELAGIRQDTYPYSDKDFLTRWSCEIMEEYPNFNITGEEWHGNPNILAYWQRGRENHDGYESCLPSLLDFPLQESLRTGLMEHQSEWSGLVQTYSMLANDHIYADPFSFVTFPDNHDMDRFFTQVGEDFDKFKNGIAFILTVRGIPQLYYGTELLFTNTEPGNHGLIRKDYPGGWSGDPVDAFTGKGLSENQKNARTYITRINQWRKTSEAVHSGKLRHFVPYQGAYVMFRIGQSAIVMTIINRNETDIDLDITRLREVLGDISEGTDVISGQTLSLSGPSLPLKARTPMIIDIRR